MRPLIFLLILLSAGSAGAVGGNSDREIKMPPYIKDNGDGQVTATLSSDTDYFISTHVTPEIEAGDSEIRGYFEMVNPETGSINRFKYEVNAERAIAHYLKALVEIETERLRRGK